MKRNFNAFVKENEAAEEKLKEVNQDFLGELMNGMGRARISAVQREIVRRDLINMAREGEARGETLEQQLGEDPRQWCAQVIAASGKVSALDVALELLYEIFGLYAVVGVMDLFWQTQVSLTMVTVCVWATWGILRAAYVLLLTPRFIGKRAPIRWGVSALVFVVWFVAMLGVSHAFPSQQVLWCVLPNWAPAALSWPVFVPVWALRILRQNRELAAQGMQAAALENGDR